MVGQFTSPLWCQFVIPKFRILATSLLIAPGCCEDEFGWWKPLENHSVWYNQKKWSILRTFKRIINILLSSVQNWIEKSHLSWVTSVQFSSVAQSCPTLRPHESQPTRPPCPWPTPRAYSNSCPLSRWYHPTISSSVAPFSSCPQSLPASGSFPMS